jgi:hypothetical protein
VPKLVDVRRSIDSIAVDDSVVVDARSVAGSSIRKDAGYGGVRIDLRATLDGARLSLQSVLGRGSPESLVIGPPGCCRRLWWRLRMQRHHLASNQETVIF